MPENTSNEKKASMSMAELLADALEKAKDSQGYWLNKAGRKQPAFYKKNVSVNAFNALLMGLHADKTESKTAQYVLFSEAKKNGYPVKQKQNGVPFSWARFENYIHRYKPDNVINKVEYQKLDPKEQELYKAHPSKELRVLFNIDQTILSSTQKEAYDSIVKAEGGKADRGITPADGKALRASISQYIANLGANLCPMQTAGDDQTYYDAGKDTVNMASDDLYDSYFDYVQDVMRSTISATGHPLRLGREAMIQGADLIVNSDAEKYEKLVEEVASAVKMQELGLPARIPHTNIDLVDYWVRELKENPHLITKLEADVNSAISMVNKANRGEKIELATERVRKQTDNYRSQPLHYAIAEKLRDMPDRKEKIMVIVLNATHKKADVILPSGASSEVNNEIPGMSKKRIEAALKKQGVETVHFYNPDGALGYHHDDSFYADKTISTHRLNKWELEKLSTLDISEAVKLATNQEPVLDNVQLAKEHDNRWVMYIKPEGQDGYGIYADANDLKLFFAAVKQKDPANIASIKTNLAVKYHTLATSHPDLKINLAGDVPSDVDVSKVQKANIYKDREGKMMLYVQVEGMEDKKLLPRPITDQQWHRLFIANDRTAFKKNLGAIVFSDILRGQNIEASIDKREANRNTRTDEVPIHVTAKMVENWISNAPKAAGIPEKYDRVQMIKDDGGRWAAYVKPVGESPRTVIPSHEDVAVFFEVLKSDIANIEDVKEALGKKVYQQYDQKPDTRVDLFKSKATDAELSLIDSVTIYRGKETEKGKGELFCTATIDGVKQKSCSVTEDQWQRMWLAPDMQEYKKHLAGTLYKDILSAKIDEKEYVAAHEDDEECSRLLSEIDKVKKEIANAEPTRKVFDLNEQLKALQLQLDNRVEMLKSASGDKIAKEVTFEIPSWAFNYIMHGNDENLTKGQKELVDTFTEKHFPDGFVPFLVEGTEKNASATPAFGGNAIKPVDTIAIRFDTGGHFESLSQEEVKYGLNVSEMHEDAECSRLIKSIENHNDTMRQETKPDRLKELSKEQQTLEHQLRERVAVLIQEKEQKGKEAEDNGKGVSSLLKQYNQLKAKHPDALLIFRTGNFYETYKDDAVNAAKILGITLIKSPRAKDEEGKPLAMAGFPFHALDTYLPRLIRAGMRVAICDQLEAPTRSAKHSVSEMLTPASQNTEKQEVKNEEPARFSHHR